MVQRLPPLYALRAFEIAARTSSFTRAADELCITQSAISRHIRNLEEVLNCRLFARSGPKLTLTEAGQALAIGLKAGFGQIEQACRPFQTLDSVLRLKAPSTLTMRWLLAVLQRLKCNDADYPVVVSSVWMDVDAVDFATEPFDCAILLGNGQFGSDVVAVKLFDEWLIPVASGQSQNQVRSYADLKHATLIHPSLDRRDWRRWLACMDLSDVVEIDRGMVFDTLDQGITAAKNGHGITIADLYLLGDEIANGHISLPLPSAIQTGDSYYFIYPKAIAHSKAIEQLQHDLLQATPVLPEHLSIAMVPYAL